MWTLTFKDINDATITVEIEGGNGTLTGAAEPLITRELETDDPFEPVRYQTGYINLVGTDGADIRPTDTFDRPVTIKKNGAIVWLGYIAVGEWNGSMSEYPKTVSLPLISALGVLKNVDYEPTATISNVYQVLKKALNMSQVNWRYLYFSGYAPSIFAFTMTDLAFETYQDKDKEYDGINANMPERGKKKTAFAVLKEICLAFGWQARESDGDIYLTTPDNSASAKRCSFSSMPTSSNVIDVTGESKTVEIASMDQSRSILPAMHQCRITANTNSLDSTILSLKMLLNKLTYSATRFYNTKGTEKKYYICDTYIHNSDIVVTNPNLNPSHPGGDTFVGDQLGRTMIYLGSALCKDAYIDVSESEDSRPDTSTTPCLTLTPSPSPSRVDIATLKGQKNYAIYSSDYMLDLNIDGILIEDDYEYDGHNDTKPIVGLYVKLQFGNLWFNGESWQSTETAFKYKPNNYDFPDNVTLEYNVHGMAIPAPDSVVGKLKLIFQTPLVGDLLEKYDHPRYIRISEASVSLCTKKTNNERLDTEELRYNAQCSPNAKDTYDATHEMYFRSGYATNPSILTHSCIIYPLSSADPSYVVLNRMKSWYERNHYKFQVEAKTSDYKPLDTALFSASNCFIGARQVNWRDAQTRLTLYSK